MNCPFQPGGRTWEVEPSQSVAAREVEWKRKLQDVILRELNRLVRLFRDENIFDLLAIGWDLQFARPRLV